jgi:hypothetical protein
MSFEPGTFGYDVQFLQQYHTDLIILSDSANRAQLAVAPEYQGRVMTSTSRGMAGKSFGWINYDLIRQPAQAEHIHAFGGEERLWLGPEGGQFSIYFKKGVPFTYENWYVPAEIDTEPFNLLSVTSTEAKFEKEMHLENYSGTVFDLRINRDIRLLSPQEISTALSIPVAENIEAVGFETANTITNTGTNDWTKESGLLSIWILSMMNASEKTVVVIPYQQGDDAARGKIVTDDYFGKVPADRLQVKDGLIRFTADGKYRSKIGIGPLRALPMAASYDATHNMLTIATFSLPADARDYVNSLWQLQNNPYEGDVVNAYNDGPVNGGQMGNLYELESSSPAAALSPGAHLTHVHRTIHLSGSMASLNAISTELLGVGVDALTRTTNKP